MKVFKRYVTQIFPGGSDGKDSVCNVGDLGFDTWSGRTPERGHGIPLRYSSWRIPMDRGALGAGYNPWVCKELDMAEQLRTAESAYTLKQQDATTFFFL